MAEVQSDAQGLKNELLALSADQFEAFKQIGSYFRLARALQAAGWVSILCGGLTFLLGSSAVNKDVLTTIQAALGALIVMLGFWAISGPGTNIFAAFSGLFLLGGLLNLFIAVSSRFGEPSWLVGLLGVFQLWWAYQTYQSYQRYAALPMQEPTSELMEPFEMLWERLSHPSPTLLPEIMTVQLTRTHDWWNGLLLPDYVVLAHKRQRALMFVLKSDLVLVPENPKSINRGKFAILARIDNESLIGNMNQKDFQQYLQWKGITDSEVEVSSDIARHRLILKIGWWAMLIVLVLIALYVVAIVRFMMQYA
jgi:hypothetical protein